MNQKRSSIDSPIKSHGMAGDQQRAEETVQQDEQSLRQEFRRRAERLRLRDTARHDRANTLAVLVCRVGLERHAVELSRVAQVYVCPRITPLPGAASALLGLVSFQGEVCSVCDLRVVLGMDSERTREGHVVLVRWKGKRVGIWVESAEQVIELDLDSLSVLESSEESRAARFVRGISPDQVLLLEIDRLLEAAFHSHQKAPVPV